MQEVELPFLVEQDFHHPSLTKKLICLSQLSFQFLSDQTLIQALNRQILLRIPKVDEKGSISNPYLTTEIVSRVTIR